MNILKKKYKRSEWMEGLLWAESLPPQELSVYVVSGGGRRMAEAYGESIQGVKDYYLYKQRVLDQIGNI